MPSARLAWPASPSGSPVSKAVHQPTPRRQILSRIEATQPPGAPRSRVILAAADCFSLVGIRAVGIDRLIREANIAKATFYDHFPSKMDLVAAYLEAWDGAWRWWFAEAVRERYTVSVEEIFAMFEVLRDLFEDGEYRGCTFARAITEVGLDDTRVGSIGVRHKAAVEAYIGEIAFRGGFARPDDLARQLLLLIDGAMTSAAREHSAAAADLAAEIARTVVASHPRREGR